MTGPTTGPTTSAAPGAPVEAAVAGAVADSPLLLRLLDAPVEAEALDVVATPLRALVHAVEPRWLADLLHGTWLGHPVHPVLAQATVGSWTSASLLDAIGLTGLVPDALDDGASAASAALTALGLSTALPTYATGWTDWSDLHEDQARLGLVHAAGNYTSTALYAVSLAQRLRGRRTSGRWWSLAALSVATVGAALGGHLAYRWAAGAHHAEHVPHVAPSGEHRIAAWDELVVDQPVQRWVGDVAVVVVRTGDGVRVLADACSHLSGPLHQGEVVVERGEACLVCPWHDSTFRLRDGVVVHGPATSPQPTFAVRVSADGDVLARLVELPGVPASAPPSPTHS